MSPTNREIQLRKTCQLYAYVLKSLGEEVPDDVQECVNSYDFPVDCVKQLVHTLQNLDESQFESIVNDPQSAKARDLAAWWEMYQIYIPVPKSESY